MKKFLIILIILICAFLAGYIGYFQYEKQIERSCNIKIIDISAQIIDRKSPDKIVLKYENTTTTIRNKELYNYNKKFVVRAKLKIYIKSNNQIHKKEIILE